MAVDLSRAAAAGFRAFGEAATYRPATGNDRAVTAIVGRPTAEAQLLGTGARAPALLADVAVSELAQPRRGDSIDIAGRAYTVRDFERDRAGATWRLTLGET